MKMNKTGLLFAIILFTCASSYGVDINSGTVIGPSNNINIVNPVGPGGHGVGNVDWNKFDGSASTVVPGNIIMINSANFVQDVERNINASANSTKKMIKTKEFYYNDDVNYEFNQQEGTVLDENIDASKVSNYRKNKK